MIDIICEFCTRLLPEIRREGAVLYPDDAHRITVEELPNGNPRFSKASLIAGNWYAMGSIEVEAGQRYFWTRVVEALRCYTGATFAMPDGLVVSVAQGLPGAEALTQERAREKEAPPGRKVTAGGANPGFTGTIRSTRRTKTRKEEDDDADVLGED